MGELVQNAWESGIGGVHGLLSFCGFFLFIYFSPLSPTLFRDLSIRKSNGMLGGGECQPQTPLFFSPQSFPGHFRDSSTASLSF